MTIGHVTRYIGIAAGLCVAACALPLDAKECYAPDARAQERAFSRAVITEGGKTIWLGGQTASLPPSPDFDTQVRQVFASLDQTLKARGGSLKDMVTMTVSSARSPRSVQNADSDCPNSRSRFANWPWVEPSFT